MRLSGRDSVGLWLLASVLLPSAVLAQGATSVLIGNVVDASTKAPVPDVVVTATSPSLQGEQVVVTDATGLYRVPQLPPGVYTLRFEKETFRPYSREQIDVAADRTLRLNVELLPEVAGAETVTVIGTAPTIDVGSSATGTTVSQEFVKNLAVARPGGLGGANRSFDSLAQTAPQANPDVYGVGINGATSPENLYLIDGLSVNNPGYGTLGTPLTAEFMDEVNVVTGGYMPEYGRTTGGAISAVTKSGGNEFHGSVFGTFSPGSLTGASGQIPSNTPVINARRDIGNIGDVGATLGGYILPDRLWFFAGFQFAKQRYVYYRSFNQLQGTTVVPIENSEQRRFGDEQSINYIGKLTYLASSDHRLSLTVTGTPTKGGGDASFPLRTRSTQRGIFSGLNWATGTFNAFHIESSFDSLDITGELHSSFLDKKLLLDVRVGWHHQNDSGLPGDGSGLDIENRDTLAGTPAVRSPALVNTNVATLDDQVPASVKAVCNDTNCGITAFQFGGPTPLLEIQKFDSYQGRAVITYLLTALGHHVFKAGFDGQINKYSHEQAYSGGVAYRSGQDLGLPAGTVFDYRRFGSLSGADTIVDAPHPTYDVDSVILGGFVQDSWSILDKVTLNIGLRYDALTIKGPNGVTGISLTDQISPRIGVVWDPTQQGRAKLFANYGRYYEYIPLDIASRSLSAETQISGTHNCDPLVAGRQGCDANTRFDGYVNIAGGANGRIGAFRQWTFIAGGPFSSSVDPDLKSPSNDEVVVGGEYEVLPNARAGVTYTYRNLVRTVEDMSLNDGVTYFIGNPGDGIGDTFPKAKRTYHGVTVSFSKTFSDFWLAQASYTWSQLKGNYDGLYNPQVFNPQGDNQLDPNINSSFDLRTLLPNQDGSLSADITHFIKLYAAKEFPLSPTLSMTLGASFNANSGPPINTLGGHPIYGSGQSFILVRGSAGRLPWVTSLDAKFGVSYRFTKDMVLTGAVEAFNIFNSQRPLRVSENYTNATVTPILGATQGTIPSEFAGLCGPAPANASSCVPGNGSLPRPRVDPASPNAANIRVGLPNRVGALAPALTLTNWGRPTAYQGVRQFRFSLRMSF